MTITLADLVEVARQKTAADRARVPATELVAQLRDSGALQRPAGRLATALRADGIQVIAEVKGASPLAGQLRTDYAPGAIAAEYVAGGAAAISVLTEPTYFGGSLEALREVADRVVIPVLRKDFIVESYLIADVLEPSLLNDLVAEAHELRLDALVEVHCPASVAAAVASGSGLIGVNNRDLDTMKVDWHHALGVVGELPTSVVRVAESGITTGEQLTRLESAGYDAALIGSSLMSAESPGAALTALLREART
jgi:indole-3-glycerol phosphate synthase